VSIKKEPGDQGKGQHQMIDLGDLPPLGPDPDEAATAQDRPNGLIHYRRLAERSGIDFTVHLGFVIGQDKRR
jgi:hypothetical protein